MSKLSQAIDDVTSAATDLRETAAALKAITSQLEAGLLPQATALVEQSESSERAITDKAVALLDRHGALAEKLTTIIQEVRDGEWIELKEIGFGGDLRIEGRIRIAKGEPT